MAWAMPGVLAKAQAVALTASSRRLFVRCRTKMWLGIRMRGGYPVPGAGNTAGLQLPMEVRANQAKRAPIGSGRSPKVMVCSWGSMSTPAANWSRDARGDVCGRWHGDESRCPQFAEFRTIGFVGRT